MKAWRWGVPLAAALALAGCGSPVHSSTPATSAPTTATTVTPSSSPTTTTSAPPTSAPTCSSSQLVASLGPGNGAAGTTYYALELRNTSATACLLFGYPGVSLVTGSDGGSQIGTAAARVAETEPTVELRPGATGYATLGVADADNYSPATCQPEEAAGIRVYPPNQTVALYVSRTVKGCTSTDVTLLTIRPFSASPAT